jgi:hypothetical protein
MKVLFVVSEVEDLVKTGGLADVGLTFGIGRIGSRRDNSHALLQTVGR